MSIPKPLVLPGIFLLALSLLNPVAVVAQSGVDEVRGLINRDRLNEALQLTNEQLDDEPGDITYRFLKGLILTRLNQLEQARDVFVSLTESHPELPEPYNNLAVIYASMGDFDQARDALERAINTHPSYATAHENMGDIYAKLASQAYNQALQLDRENITAKAKLSLINDLFSVPKPEPALASQQAMATPVQDPAAPESAAPESAAPEPAAPEPAASEPAASEPAASELAASEPAASEPAQPETAAAQRAEPQPAEPTEPSPPAEPALDTEQIRTAVRQAVAAWSAAWTAQDVEAYLDHYADSFSPPSGQSLAAWREERRVRVSAPEFIRVTVSNLEVRVFGPEYAQATFTQEYQSDTYGDRVTKLLLFARQDGSWLITQEATK